MKHPRFQRLAASLAPILFGLCLLGGALPVGGFGVDPRGPLAPPDPAVPAQRKQARASYDVSVEPRQALLEYEVDTLSTHLAYTARSLDGHDLGTVLRTPEEALFERVKAGNRQTLVKSISDAALKQTTGGATHLEIDIPFKVKSKTFRRIFGSGRIGLNVQGSVDLAGTYRSEKRESESANNLTANQNDFRLDQDQQFTVVGKIGEKVDVHIDQNTERSFDFENNLSIIYTGEPEEVIEKIEAGNISLALPSTQYVQFSDKSSGLFGLKMVNRFGPLRLTGIASTEKNESKQQTFTGQSSDQNRELGPGEHMPGYFFLNEMYRHLYRVYSESWTATAGSRVTALRLYEFNGSTDPNLLTLALYSPDGTRLESTPTSFKEIWNSNSEDTKTYSLDKDRGILRGSFQADRYYAIAYTLDDGGRALNSWYAEHGRHSQSVFTGNWDENKAVVLLPANFGPGTQPYWDLQLRSVYNLGSPGMDVSKFEMSIGKAVSGANDETRQGSDDYLRVLYLDVTNVSNNGNGNDGKVDERWVEQETGYIWFPSPRPFSTDPEAWVLQPASGTQLRDYVVEHFPDHPDPDLYLNYKRAPNTTDASTSTFTRVAAFADTTLNELYTLRGNYSMYGLTADPIWRELNQTYNLSSSAKVGTEVISLGWNVTNVVVTANGRRLAQGKDYTLDEQAGLIRIINQDYTREDQKIQVSYETPQLFQLRKKTFAGMTAEYSLYDDGKNSGKLGAAYIYFNEETAERKVRLGNEPIKNSVFDLNAKLSFSPRMMTTWMDALPLIEADEPSSLSFETEYAVVMPDPNPSNNPDTGDDHGVAYVDDFEGSKQEIPLSLGHTQWGLSAQPSHLSLGQRGWMGWFNPEQRVKSSTIWPNSTSSSSQNDLNNDVRVLKLEYWPFALQGAGGDDGQPLADAEGWGGLYYDFRNAYDDLSQKKFLELTLLVEGDRSGTLNLDLGLVSEDVIPDGVLQTEDGNSNKLLEEVEDIGLDNMEGPDPEWPLSPAVAAFLGTKEDQVAQLGVSDTSHAYDWWDLDKDKVRQPWEPWSMDNYVQKNENSDREIDKSHGGEGNSSDSDQLYPDTEDRNGNLALDAIDQYFSYQVPLNPGDPLYREYVSPIENSAWLFVRIPLQDPNRAEAGVPRLDQIGGLRVWLTGFRDKVNLTLAEVNIVGTEWTKSITEGDTTGFDVSVLNNFDNSDRYSSPPGVTGNKEMATNVVSREQALVVELQDLPYGRTAWVKKTLDVRASLAEYRELKMFVHGGAGKTVDDSLAFLDEFGNDGLEYHLRLQSTTGNYYEYSKFIQAGWNPSANNLHILLSTITAIEQFEEAGRGQEEPGKPVLLPDGGQVVVVGNPSINNISAMLLGVTNHRPAPARTEVWFNELRVSNVKKNVSRAMRAKLDAKFSNVLDVSGSFDQQDADFHTVKERAPANPTFKRNFGVSGNVELGRLLPPSYGVSAKLNVSNRQSLSVPKYYPNDDQEVDLGKRPQEVETWSRDQGATLTLKKSNSQSAWLKETLDKVSFNTSVSNRISRNTTVAMDTTFTQTFSTGYSNQFPKLPKLKPLGFAAGWPLLGKAAETQLGLLPESFSVNASTNRNIQHTWRRDLTQTSSETYTLNRSWSTSFKPLTSFTFSLNRGYNGSNLRFRRNQAAAPTELDTSHANYAAQRIFLQRLDQWKSTGEATLHDMDDNISQKATFNWTPKLVDWTSTSFTYNADYGWSRNLSQPASGVSLNSGGVFSADLKPDLAKLARKLMWMSEEELNAAKKELGDAKTERAKQQAARATERQRRKDEKRAAREARKAGAPPATAGPDSLMARPATPADSLAGREAVREPGKEPPADPAQPVERIDDPEEVRDAQSPEKPRRLGKKTDRRQESDAEPPAEPRREPVLQPLRPLAPDSLLAALPDSLRGQLALADSLIRAAALQDSSHAGLDSTQAAVDSLAKDKGGLWRGMGRAAGRVGGPVGRGFAGVWKRAGVFTTRFEPIDARFTRNETRTDPGMAIYPWTPVGSRHASWGYQLGVDPDPGVDTLRVSTLTFTPTHNFSYNWSLGTRVTVAKDLPVRLNYDYTFSQGFSNRRETSRKEAWTGWYRFENDPLLGKGDQSEGDLVGAEPTVVNLPDYSLQLRGLEKLPGMAKRFKSLSLSHGYKGDVGVDHTRGTTAMERSKLSYTRNFEPLAGLEFQLDKGWGGNASLKNSRSLAITNPDNPNNRVVTLDVTRGWTLSAQKALRNGFKLPGFKQRFKNETTLKLTYDTTKKLQLRSMKDTAAEGALVWNTPLESSSWSLALSTDYAFSRNVKGGGSLKYGVERSSQANDKKNYLEVKVSCHIDVRSK